MDDGDREELVAIAASLRAHLEWQLATGATGLPRSARVAAAEPAALIERPTLEPRAALSEERFERAPTRPIAAISSPRTAPASPEARKPAPARPAPVSAEERLTRLSVLADEVRACTGCGLHATRTQTVFSRGNPDSSLVFVGEGPGADEDAQGEPFLGKSGELLDRMITAMGFARDEVYICNLVKCRPPEDRNPESAELAACAGFIASQLELLQPKAIVALGAAALQGLTGVTEGISRVRGKWKLYKGRIPVMPTFHPAYVLRQPAAKREVWADLQEVMRILGKGPERSA
jgi:DNA polymerase